MNYSLKDGILLYNQNDNPVLCHGYLDKDKAIISISQKEYDTLKYCDGALEVEDIARKLNLDVKEIILILDDLDKKYSFLFHRDIDKRSRNIQDLLRLKKNLNSAKEVALQTNVIHYHEHEIIDANKQFDFNETTVSHMFREPTQALRGLRFGEALCDKLINKSKEIDSIKILEVGCGLGFLAQSFLDRLKEKYPLVYSNVSYTLFDLSPMLQDKQKENCSSHIEKTQFLSGNIENYNFESSKFDIIISNEVIADLNVAVGNKELLNDKAKWTETEKIINKYELNLENYPKEFILNIEAIKLVEKLKNLLNVDGMIYLSEYGSVNKHPDVVKLPGHNEYSINFGHLLKVTNVLGLNGEVLRMGDFLHFDDNYEVISNNSRAVLHSYLLPYLGIDGLKVLASNKEMLKKELGSPLFDSIQNIKFWKLGENRTYLNPNVFLVLFIQNRRV